MAVDGPPSPDAASGAASAPPPLPEAPDLWQHIQNWIYHEFGLWGLIALAAATVLVGVVWWRWEDLTKRPGVGALLTRLSRRPLPRFDPRRFGVAVARLENDRDGEFERLIVEDLEEFEGVEVRAVDRLLRLEGGSREESERRAHEAARGLLAVTGAAVLVWGTVLRQGDKAIPKLYLTAVHGGHGGGRYALGGAELRLPEVFWGELRDVLRLLIFARDAEFRAEEGRYVADRLGPFIDRVRGLLRAAPRRAEWDAEAVAATRVVLADGLSTLGEQTGQDGPLEEAVAAYREALKEYTRERAPLDWAMTQNNLGNALQTLGARESGTARLEEAVEAYEGAMEIFGLAGAGYYAELAEANLRGAKAEIKKRRRSAAAGDESAAAR